MIFKISFNLFYVQLSFSGLLVFLLLISVILITVIIIITSILCIVCPVISIMFVIRLKTAIIYSIIHTFNRVCCVCFIYRVRYRNCCTVGCLSFLWYTLHFIAVVSVGGYSGAGTFWLLQFFSKF